MEFKNWLLSLEQMQAVMLPSTGGGGIDDYDNEDGDDDGDDGWDWERMEKWRWSLLKWCAESDSMKQIAQVAGEMAGTQKVKKTTYRINASRVDPKYRYVLQLGFEFEMDMSPMESNIRGILEKSDLHKALKINQSELYRLLENDEVREYVTYVICLYLSTHPSQKSSPFTQSHFGWSVESILSNYFSFNVWNRLKKGWDSKILPQMSEIAISSRDKVERPADWVKVGKPEVKSEFSLVKIAGSVTVYSHEKNSMLASVTVMIPFDWNRIP